MLAYPFAEVNLPLTLETLPLYPSCGISLGGGDKWVLVLSGLLKKER